MEDVLLQASLFLSAAVIAVPLSQRLGLGSVLGYLLAGVLLSPILHLIGSNTEQIQHYAEFGIIIMLFLIGLEMQPGRIWDMRESLIGLGGLQIFITASILTFVAIQIGLEWQTSVAIALILTLSSTAIVLQTLIEKKIQHTEIGRSAIAILLMQDIAVIPILAILPLLALQELQVDALLTSVLSGQEIINEDTNSSIIAQLPGWITALTIGSSIALLIMASTYLTEPIIKYISKYGTGEIFLAATFLLIISIAYLMTIVGLSPALGTFLVGLVLSNSKHRHALASTLDPFKGLLLGLFFITVGAGMNFTLLVDNFFVILGLTLSLILIKGTILFVLSKVFLLEKNSSFLIALYLSQAGEFGFVLLALAKTAHVIPHFVAENLSLVIALSMLITPLLFFLLQNKKFSIFSAFIDPPITDKYSTGQAILIGMNTVGETTTDVLKSKGVDLLILDQSASKIKILRQRGVKAFLGDGTNVKLLTKAGISTTQVVIVTISNTKKSLTVTDFLIKNYPNIKVVVRALDAEHYKNLYACGAREIILEPHCSGMHIGGKVLSALGETTSDFSRLIKSFNPAGFENTDDHK